MFFGVRRFISRQNFEPGRHIWGPAGKAIGRIFPENGDFQLPPREALGRESSREWRYGKSVVADRKPFRFGPKAISILFGRTTKAEVSFLRSKFFMFFQHFEHQTPFLCISLTNGLLFGATVSTLIDGRTHSQRWEWWLRLSVRSKADAWGFQTHV